MKPALIFDLDGTLVDSAPSILAAFGAALDEAGVRPRVPLESGIIGPPLKETLAILAGSDDPAVVEPLAAGFKRHYDETGYQQTKVFPGVADMLENLAARGADLHIATNKRLLPTERILGWLGWRPWFRTVYALDMAGRGFRDKSAMIAGQLGDLALSSTSACYIGDRAEDRHAAERNGLPFIAACWGYGGFADAPPSGVALAALSPVHLSDWYASR